ncbi:B12-binding domain-containing radical SAM protein [Pseudomonas sp. Irchel 3A18]|uniref:B12-binding domain-containing radical SAM protein n=1 Tax=Pseudomonas sp. Irchel 3A18 TaxID=2008905 RepID=UPI000BA2F555|nr:B12-binding domain-containing radical SAM protein [Pseudomonas sp. Irchel 3A18]
MRPVILVSLDWRRPQDGKTGLGIASIAAALRAAGVSFQIIDAQVNSPSFSLEQVQARLQQAITQTGPGCLVGFGTFVWNDDKVRALTHSIQNTGAEVVLGGPQISYMAKGQLERTYPLVRYFVRGQGEMAMVALACGTSPDDCGIHIAGTPDLGRKADHDLLTLPSPYLLETAELQSSIRWETQRGCPFKCSFCQHREPGIRLKHQWFDGHRLEKELAMFAAAKVQRISVLDPIFHNDAKRAIQILNSAKAAGVTAHLSLQCRFETCTPDFLDALEGLNVTLEFGLQTTVEAEYRAIKRPNHLDIVCSRIRQLHERQIDFEVSLIYGLPNQTLDSFRSSVDWCVQRRVPRVRAWPLMLLRGTPLYEQKQLYGFKESDDQAIPIVVASNSFSETEYAEMARIAKLLEEN